MFNKGDLVQFRKCGAWNGEAGEWTNGMFESESRSCYFIRDSVGKVNECWKHRIEIRIQTFQEV